MIKDEFKFIRHNKLIMLSVIVIMFIPFLYAIFFLKSVWDPYGDTQALPVAVVNNDVPVEYEGKTLDVGAQTVKKLKHNDQLGWKFVSAKKAAEGLKHDKYYTVVTIPKNFSKHAATVLDAHPKKMQLKYTTNDSLNYLSQVISGIGVDKLDKQIRASVTNAYASAVFDQIKTVGKGFSKAASGATQLSDGTVTLDDGVSQYTVGVSTVNKGVQTLKVSVSPLTSGVKQLTTGAKTLNAGVATMPAQTTKLANGANSLSSGVSQYVTGTNTLAAGANTLNQSVASMPSQTQQLASGAKQVSDGAAELSTSVTDLPAQTKALNTGAQSVATGVGQYVAGVNEAFTQLKAGPTQMTTGLTQLQAAVSGIQSSLSESTTASQATTATIKQDLQKLVVSLSASQDQANLAIVQDLAKQLTSLETAQAQSTTQLTSVLNQMGTGLTQLQTGTTNMTAGITQANTLLQTKGEALQTGAEKLVTTGTQPLATSAPALTAGAKQLATGSAQVTAGTQQLASGATTLVSGTQQLAAGGQQLAANGSALTSGAAQVAAGTTTVAQSAPTLVAGTSALASGLTTLQNKLPSLASGVTQLADGTSQLADKSSQLTDGTSKLKSGSKTLATSLSAGAKQVNGIKLTNETAKMFSAPTHTTQKHYSYVSNYGHALAPYVLSLALYVGAIVFNFAYPIRKVSHQDGTPTQWFASKVVLGGLVAVGMAVIEASLIMLGGLTVDHVGLFYAFAIVFSLTSMYFVMMLSMAFDNPGRFVAMIMLMLQLGGAGGTFPLEITNGFYNAIHPFLPMSYSVLGFRQAITSGIYSGSVANCFAFLIGFALVSLVLLWVAMQILQKRHLMGISQLDDNQKLQDVEK